MDSEQINRWLTLGANLGVLIGLALLLVELNQTSEIQQVQTRNDLATAAIGFLYNQATNPSLAKVIVKASSGEQLTPEEQWMYESRSEAVFRYWENVHYQYREGMYDQVEFTGHLNTMRGVIEDDLGLRRYWCLSRERFSKLFVEQIDRFVTVESCGELATDV